MSCCVSESTARGSLNLRGSHDSRVPSSLCGLEGELPSVLKIRGVVCLIILYHYLIGNLVSYHDLDISIHVLQRVYMSAVSGHTPGPSHSKTCTPTCVLRGEFSFVEYRCIGNILTRKSTHLLRK